MIGQWVGAAEGPHGLCVDRGGLEHLARPQLLGLIYRQDDQISVLATLNTALAARNAELAAKNTELAAGNAELAARNTELVVDNAKLRSANTGLVGENTNLWARLARCEDTVTLFGICWGYSRIRVCCAELRWGGALVRQRIAGW